MNKGAPEENLRSAFLRLCRGYDSGKYPKPSKKGVLVVFKELIIDLKETAVV